MAQLSLASLQSMYPLFSYDSFSHQVTDGKCELRFSFSCGDHHFTTVDTISGVTQDMITQMGEKAFAMAVFQLGLAEMASYWKAFCSPIVEIRCGSLDQTQRDFWHTLFSLGLGEFFYQNQIPPFSPHFVCPTAVPHVLEQGTAASESVGDNEPILVPVGGGKDSIVTLELLAKAGRPIYTFSGLKGACPQVIDLFGSRHPRLGDIIFSRTLDPHLMELNTQGHPNGHTPFSSVLAFFTVLTAWLYQIPVIAVSNEGSSNEATGSWMGIDVNHQYSKSFQFEQDFQAYASYTFGNQSPLYCSFLRPLDELTIMRLFVTFPEYFSTFKSCNVGQKENIWCGKCAKCAFVALLLAAYLDNEIITSIFGTDILNDMSLIPHIDALLGNVEFKPFECVGTRRESMEALQLAIKRRDGELPAVLAHFSNTETEAYLSAHPVEIYQHAMPSILYEVLKAYV